MKREDAGSACIPRAYARGFKSAVKPDRFNYLQMGNALPHLHFHAIPRYASPRIFINKEWVDETYGHPPKWSNKRVETNVIVSIRNSFLQQLKK